MLRQTFILLTLLLSTTAFAQVLQETNARQANRIFVLKEGLRLPMTDTTQGAPFLLNYTGSNSRGGMIYDTILNKVAYWNGTYWTLFSSGATLSLTTTGTSGVATYNSGTGVLNIPNYTTAPAGSHKQIQFNNSGAFGGASLFYYNPVNDRIGVNQANPEGQMEIYRTASDVVQLALTNTATTNVAARLQLYNSASTRGNIGSGAALFYSSPTVNTWTNLRNTLGFWNYSNGGIAMATNSVIRFSIDSSGKSIFNSVNGSGDNDFAHSSSLVEMKSTTLGLLIPRHTTAQRNAISSAAANLSLANTELDINNDYNGTVWGVEDGVIFTQTADKNINTTAAETTMFGTGSGTLTIPANYLTTGNTITIKIQGYMTTNGTPTLDIKFKVGSTVICSTGATALIAVGTNGYFEAECTLTARAAPSASSAIMGQGKFNYYSGATTFNTISAMSAATVNAATNGSLAVDVTATFGTSDAANKIVSTNAIVTIHN